MRRPDVHADTAADDRSEVRRAVTRFLGLGLLALVVVAVPAALWIRAEAEQHALANAIVMTDRLAEYSIGPLVTQDVLDGDRRAMAELDAWVRPWLAEDAIVRIKIWNTDGRIVYSDVPQLVGRRFDTPQWWSRVVAGGAGEASLGHHLAPDNAYESDSGELVEVYVRAHAETGQLLIVEAYFDDAAVRAEQTAVLLGMAPVFLLSLALLQLVQLLPAIRLARRIQVHQANRRRLLQFAVEASDLERRRIARDLHDEVIQDLAGLSYALEAEATHGSHVPGTLLERARAILRANIQTLRGITRDLYPADLDTLGLDTALARLADPLLERGIEVTVSVPDAGPDRSLDRERSALIYRVAREALSNVLKHSGADSVELSLTRNDFRVLLIIRDDGCGFDPSAAPTTGHLGLRILRDTVDVAGGSLTVQSTIGGGTSVIVSLDRPFMVRGR
ncbi:sensor histidine kinase [Cryobacterium melibiosiphilum]|uniref:Sensor histidine kinase n=1 Tax=Cryobacterium melibiosiphilum TaxID=995039 RepID=A0A3A5MCV5_9MICO|nr:sensor histidine kinase [Cryobacterium melibiosiphilum]